MKFSTFFLVVSGCALALPLNRKDTASPDATAIEYAVIAGSPESPDTTGWSKREDLSNDTTGWARREDSKDDTTGWSKREDSPDATMVEYALDTSAERTK